MKMVSAGAALALTVLTGCAGLTGQPSINALNKADLDGASFSQALASEYRELANFEWTDMMDYADGLHHAHKGLAAAAGETVAPDTVDSRHIPAFATGDLSEARARLTAALASGAGERNPKWAAKAQAKYDCWLEQQEENHQPEHIAACRAEFDEAMAKLGKGGAGRYMVFFNTNSAELTPAARNVIKQAAKAAKAEGVKAFSIVGHTDTVGNAASNQALSDRRAAAVKAALAKYGFKADKISTSGNGESQLMVATGDNVGKANNRRAEIRFR